MSVHGIISVFICAAAFLLNHKVNSDLSCNLFVLEILIRTSISWESLLRMSMLGCWLEKNIMKWNSLLSLLLCVNMKQCILLCFILLFFSPHVTISRVPDYIQHHQLSPSHYIHWVNSRRSLTNSRCFLCHSTFNIGHSELILIRQ